jgi:hypothetical protein
MTAAKLRSVLEEVDPDAVVCLEVPAGGIGDPELATFLSVQVRDRGSIDGLQPDLEDHG